MFLNGVFSLTTFIWDQSGKTPGTLLSTSFLNNILGQIKLQFSILIPAVQTVLS